MAHQVQDVTNDKVERLLITVYHAFVKVKSNITTHHLNLAYFAPPVVNMFNCASLCACTIGWEVAWKEGPADMFHHPDLQFSGCGMLERLESTQLPQVCKGGFSLSLMKEEGIVDDAIGNLK